MNTSNLISKEKLLIWIGEALEALEGMEGCSLVTDAYYRSKRELIAIINESHCCIDDCTDLECLYRWLYCAFRRSLKWLDEKRHKDAVDVWMRQLDKAWHAMGPITVEQLKGNDVSDVLFTLGFSERKII